MPNGQPSKLRYSSFLRQRIFVAVALVIGCLFVLFFIFVPVKHQRGIVRNCGSRGDINNLCSATCEGLLNPAGLSPETTKHEKYHLLFGQYRDYDTAVKQYNYDNTACVGGLDVIDVQLYL